MIAGKKGRRDEPEPCHACEKLTAANRMALLIEPEKSEPLAPCEKAVIPSIKQIFSVFLQNHGRWFLTPGTLDWFPTSSHHLSRLLIPSGIARTLSRKLKHLRADPKKGAQTIAKRLRGGR
jgi:hypothetical protein